MEASRDTLLAAGGRGFTVLFRIRTGLIELIESELKISEAVRRETGLPRRNPVVMGGVGPEGGRGIAESRNPEKTGLIRSSSTAERDRALDHVVARAFTRERSDCGLAS